MTQDREKDNLINSLLDEIRGLKKKLGRADDETSILHHVQTEEDLERERNQLRTLIDNIPDYVYFKDVNSRFIDANQATIRIMKCKSREELIGKTDFDFYPRKFAEKFFEDEQEIIKTGKAKLDIEEFVLNEDNQIRYLSTSKLALRTKTGEIIGMIGIGRDMTERKQAEEILRRDKETLEKIVEERSRELIKTQIELERAKRLSDIGTLAATVAHELRNPLAAISMAAHNIKRKAKEVAVLDRHLNSIEKKVSESDQIINNLLFYSRLRPPHFEKVDLKHILDECVETASRQSKKTVQFERRYECVQSTVVEVDALQMKEVFFNLINNAIDAVPDGAGKISVEAACRSRSFDLKIIDNGVGIAEEDLDSIFNPFFTTKAKGTGLGLTVCHQIINMHGGSIGIESEPGKGTTVTVNLPRQEQAHISP